jgi:hypothetical protein
MSRYRQNFLPLIFRLSNYQTKKTDELLQYLINSFKKIDKTYVDNIVIQDNICNSQLKYIVHLSVFFVFIIHLSKLKYIIHLSMVVTSKISIIMN